MQSTSSSQNIAGSSECQFVPSNADEPKDNQHSSRAFGRAVTTGQDTSASTVTGEQSSDSADTIPPDSGLVARTITETQALSVRSEPMSQSGIMTITPGRFNPLTARRPIGNPVIEDLQLPGDQHTYQPYFWLSPLAHDQLAPFATRQRRELQSQVIDQLLMSESAAKENFQAHFEYRRVDYGFTSVDASGEREKNYGVFARKPIAEGTLLGIYSGIGYLLKKIPWAKKMLNEQPEYAHRLFTEEMPEFMSYYRTMMAGLRDKEQTQRTPMKYSLTAEAKKPQNFVAIVPDKNLYTPMHFVNSANRPEDANTDFDLIYVKTDSDKYLVLVFVAIKEIAAGQELLASYIKPRDRLTGTLKRSAAEEKIFFKGKLDDHLELIKQMNSAVPNRRPISPIVAAPALNLSEILRKAVRGKGAKKDQPSGIGTSGD